MSALIIPCRTCGHQNDSYASLCEKCEERLNWAEARPPAQDSPLLLNLGAGYVPLPEPWTNLDRMQGQEIYPLPYPDGAAQTIRASHVLEHFSHKQARDVVREWVRVLKPGGVLMVAVPDFNWCAEQYLAGRDIPLQSYVMGGHQDENDHHGAIYDEGGLTEVLAAAGLVDIQPWRSDVQDCASLPVSLNLQGRKPAEGERKPTPLYMPVDPRKVAAVMSMPRLAFTDNMFCAMLAAKTLGFSLERMSGVYWHQSMANLFDRHLEDGTEFILTLDYDTVFEPQDVCELLRLMVENPQADAVCALQVGRDRDAPLFHTGGRWQAKEGEAHIPMDALEADLLPVLTGHFGLTVLRVSALKNLPRPWFHARPAPDGTWGEGRTDSDISFWREWHDAGRSLYLANRVVVGHLQMVVTWPSEEMQAQHQFIGAYLKDGKPAAGVWQ